MFRKKGFIWEYMCAGKRERSQELSVCNLITKGSVKSVEAIYALENAKLQNTYASSEKQVHG